MTIIARLYSPSHPPLQGGTPFFERDISEFELQLSQLKPFDNFDIPFGQGGTIELTPLRKQNLEMEGIFPEVTPEVVSILVEDGWTAINTPRFFDLFGFPVLDGEVH